MAGGTEENHDVVKSGAWAEIRTEHLLNTTLDRVKNIIIIIIIIICLFVLSYVVLLLLFVSMLTL
jgi:hypothetical protein